MAASIRANLIDMLVVLGEIDSVFTKEDVVQVMQGKQTKERVMKRVGGHFSKTKHCHVTRATVSRMMGELKRRSDGASDFQLDLCKQLRRDLGNTRLTVDLLVEVSTTAHVKDRIAHIHSKYGTAAGTAVRKVIHRHTAALSLLRLAVKFVVQTSTK